MKHSNNIKVLLIASMVIVCTANLSCKKELDCYDCKENKSPVAMAGPDQTIILPKDSVLLDGSASTDLDGTITSYKWIKISGPSARIIDVDAPKTMVRQLVGGVTNLN